MKVLLALITIILVSCNSVHDMGAGRIAVTLPLMQVADSGECYYLDNFMPTPNSIQEGKSGGLYTRHYTYRAAIFKDYSLVNVTLSFYSPDKTCWSLWRETILP